MDGSPELLEFAINFRVTPLMVTFLIAALGLAFGELKVFGVGFGSSGVLIIAMFAGYFYELPSLPELQDLGIVLFLWAVGIEAGPHFFRAFRQSGRQFIALAMFLLSVAGLTAYVGMWFGYSPSLTLGLLAGAMTSTPALVSATQVAERAQVMLGYGVAYPFGLLGVILFIQITLKILRGRMRDETPATAIVNGIYRLDNRKFDKKMIKELDVFRQHEVVVASILRDGTILAAGGKTVLVKGDVLRIEGKAEDIEAAGKILGSPVSTDTSDGDTGELDTRLIAVENVDNVNRSLSELGIRLRYNATITKVIRASFEMYPDSNLVLHFGDIVEVVGSPHHLDQIELFLGHKHKMVQPRVDILSFVVMLGLSFLAGNIVIPAPFIGELSPGIAGGALLIGLLFGHFGRIGNFIGRFPTHAVKVMKEFGLAMFFVQLGITAGAAIIGKLGYHVLYDVGFAMIMLTTPMAAALVFGFFVLKLSLSQCYGVICGGMTFTPGLEIIRTVDKSEKPVVAYSAAYPVALIAIIVLIQVLYRIAP